MKSLMIKTRIVAVALATLFTVALSAPVFANNEKNEAPVELKYLGEFKGQPVFELTFNNKNESEFIVTIVDQYKNVLYRDVVKSDIASKKYMLNTDQANNVALQFEITGKKSNSTVAYEIRQKSRVVEDVIINQVK